MSGKKAWRMVELPQLNRPQPTEVGNYFVANYPPFSAWAPAHVPTALAALEARSPAEAPLGLYLHIPFCRKRCTFCYFRVYTDKNAGEVEAYAAALAGEVALYARQPALAGRQFQFVYFGGGTPSFLSSGQLLRLVDRIRRHWQWDAAREVTFECEPGTLKRSKVETIRRIGVTRLSLGVEHFDDEVLALNGRAHRSPEIFRAWEWIREAGFPQVNIDLIAGMVGETEEKWKATVEQALRLDADSVTIYQMELPFNTVISRQMLESHSSAPVADWPTKRRWVDDAFRQFEAAGYRVSSAYTLVKPSAGGAFVYRDALWHGADLVGTGVASFSHLAGVHFQNHDGWAEYLGSIAQDRLPIARALPATPGQRLIREFILQLKTGSVDTGYFLGKFGTPVEEAFGPALQAMEQQRLLDRVDGRIILRREGLLRVDSLLPRFFERQFQEVRYT
jgi:oxygen-independent coproporphyrinogen-3 oxidase